MIKLKYLFLILLIIPSLSAQDNNNKVLVKVGNINITVDEFIQRYEFSPQLYTHMKGREEFYKERVLYTLIAEKLWALEANEFNYDTTDFMKYSFKAIEKMFVRDALYRQEIKNKIQISDEERFKALRKNAYILYTNFIFSTSKIEILDIWAKLNLGQSFQSILNQRPEYNLQSEPYKIVYGQMEEITEDSLYKLNIGDYSKPLQAPHGYYIFKLISKEENILYNQEQAEQEDKKVKETLRARKTAKLYRQFYDDFFKNISVRGNGPIITKLATEIHEILNQRKIELNIPDTNKTYLKYSDLYRLENELGNENLNQNILQIYDKKISLKEFLYQFLLEGFGVDSLTEKKVLKELNSRVRSFAEFEALADEGFRRGLHNLPEVQADIKMWRESYLAGMFKENLLKESSVVDEDKIIDNQENVLQKKYNIIELLTNDLDVIDIVLKKIEEGADFRKLAIEHTEREWTKNNNGEFGYFSAFEYGEIGRAVVNMQIGEIYGPISTDDGYSIFKLIDITEEKILSDNNLNEHSENIRKSMIYSNYFSNKIEKTVELAQKYEITINEELLKSLELTTIPMFTYRIIGFGGKIIAVPLVAPFIEWVEKWKETQVDIP